MSETDIRIQKMSDIARLADVSTATVSRALRDSPLINPETKARIQAIAKAHNYKINQSARNLRLKRSQTIAVVIPIDSSTKRLISDPFYLELIGSIADTVSDMGYSLLLPKAHASQEWYEDLLRDGRADGLIIVGRKTPEEHAMLERLQFPFVVWGPVLAGQSYCSVGSDSVKSAYKAVKHLAQIGRKRIAFLGGYQTSPEEDLRFQGYQQALQEADLPVDPKLSTDTLFTAQSGYEATKHLLSQGGVDGIFANSDVLAISAIEALRDEGLDVPNKVSVVGYDDLSLASHYNLTTIRQNIIKGGQLLVNCLLRRIAGESVPSTVLSTKLVIRKSCGSLQ